MMCDVIINYEYKDTLWTPNIPFSYVIRQKKDWPVLMLTDKDFPIKKLKIHITWYWHVEYKVFTVANY